MLFSQAYPTLLATYFSINRGQLNVVDSHIAIIITSSPVCIYLLYSALLDLVGRPNEFFKRIATSKLTIKILSLLLLVLWFSLTLIVSFSSTAFVDSDQCKKGKFSAWLQLILASVLALLLFWFVDSLSSCTLAKTFPRQDSDTSIDNFPPICLVTSEGNS